MVWKIGYFGYCFVFVSLRFVCFLLNWSALFSKVSSELIESEDVNGVDISSINALATCQILFVEDHFQFRWNSPWIHSIHIRTPFSWELEKCYFGFSKKTFFSNSTENRGFSIIHASFSRKRKQSRYLFIKRIYVRLLWILSSLTMRQW